MVAAALTQESALLTSCFEFAISFISEQSTGTPIAEQPGGP
jgi:hypothetical protein